MFWAVVCIRSFIELHNCIIKCFRHICFTMFSALYHTIALRIIIGLYFSRSTDLIQKNNFWLCTYHGIHAVSGSLHKYSGTLYSGHHWDHSKCPDFRGFLISGVDFIHICMYLWQNQVSRFEGCLDLRVSGVRGFIVLQ